MLRHFTIRTALVFVAVAFSTLSPAGPVTESRWELVAPGAAALAAAPPIASDPALATASQAKLHSQLRTAAEAYAAGATTAGEASSLPAVLFAGNKILVEIVYRDAFDAAAQERANNLGVVLKQAAGERLLEAWVPLDRLTELAEDPAIARILPARLVRHYAQTSQGVAAGRADRWQSAGYTGSGVTIALIDTYNNTANQLAGLQASGDWPPAARLTKINQKGTGTFGDGGDPHGNATLEIAYDIAPAATYRAYDTVTVTDWYNALKNAADNSAKVISASLGAPLDGIGDGTAQPGSIAEAAAYAVTKGSLVVNAAGNERQQHWGGNYTPMTGNITFHSWNGATIYNFFGDGLGGAYCLATGEQIQVELFWNDWTSVNKNYDLVLYRQFSSAGWTQVAISNFPQSGSPSTQSPQEFVQYTVQSTDATPGCSSGAVFSVAVNRVTVSAVNNLQVFANVPLNYRVNARSLGFPADSPNVLSVAAVDVTSSVQEPYSSEGPVLAAGGGISVSSNPATDTNLKPELASFANVNTVSYGAGVFNGTSSATPHVAGMAVLLLQRYGPTLSLANLRTALQSIAGTGSNDHTPAGRDYQYGIGRMRFQKETALSYEQQPSNSAAGVAIAPSVRVGVRDDENLLVNYGIFNSIGLSLAIDPSGSATLTGTSAVLASGVAAFAASSIDKVGTGYKIRASAGSLPVNDSSAFNITPGAASRLKFNVQPGDATAGAAISPTVTVRVEDAFGNLRSNDNATQVTLNLANNPPGATLTGNGPVSALAGIASFPALSINKSGTGFTLSASSGALTQSTSSAFNINPGAAAKLSFAQQPTSVAVGALMTTPVRVRVEDALGNLVISDNATQVTLAVASCADQSPHGGGPVIANAGIAQFTSLRLYTIANGVIVQASAPARTGASSSAFNVTANPELVYFNGFDACMP